MRHIFVIMIVLVLGSIAVLAATEAPAPSQPIFVTNTPQPPDPLRVTPDAPLEQYALRLWTEQDFINLLTSQINRLIAGDTRQQNAIRLTLFEMTSRFPGAPRALNQRERLMRLMLAAPRGSLDLRDIVRPFIVAKLNEETTRMNPEAGNTLTISGFLVQTTPFKLNADDIPDTMIALRYPADAVTPDDTIYQDYWLLQGTAGGGFVLMPSRPDFPAAPYGDIQDMTLVRADDVNLDGLDELAVSIDTDSINDEVFIYGWRNTEIANLIQPGERILVGELVGWTSDSATLTVQEYRLEAPKWDCIAQLRIQWQWISNFYRPFIPENTTYQNLRTIGCALYEQEPLFVRPADDGITLVSTIMMNPNLDAQGWDRAGIALAMFYLLDGQITEAETQIASLLPSADSNRWLAGQIEAFASTARSDGVSPVQVCGALLAEDETGACQIDQVLAQTFVENPILRSENLVQQLETLGLPVLEVVTVSQVGRANREVVSFNLTGSSWWAFAPTNPEFYVPSPTDPPVLFEETALPIGFVAPPKTAYDALLVNSDPVTALNAIENARLQNPDSPLSPEARFLRALAYDLLSDRQAARREYFALWSEFTGNGWGQLAGAHLERRS